MVHKELVASPRTGHGTVDAEIYDGADGDMKKCKEVD